jgi:carboxymethylenebutenolidase
MNANGIFSMKIKAKRLLFFCALSLNFQTFPCFAETAINPKNSQPLPFEQQIITFPSRDLMLGGIVYKPIGPGPFPAILFNHGSSLETHAASDALGPMYANHGWVFFMPSRRGQGLSRRIGNYIGDEIEKARKNKGDSFAVETMVKLLQEDHLNDQMAAVAWLKKQSFVASNRIAVAGVSFGGIQTVLGVQSGQYCAGIDAAGAAQSWFVAPKLQKLMIHAVQNAKAPIFFFQAKNDYDLETTYVLSAAMKIVGKKFQMKIYPPFGKSVQDGHAFGYFGSSAWSKDVFVFLNKYCVG